MTSKPSVNGSSCPPASVKADDQCADRSNLAKSASTYAPQVVDLSSESHNISAKSIGIPAPRSAESTKIAKVNRSI